MNEVDVSKRSSKRCFTHGEALLFISLYYFKIHCKKKCYFVLKEVLFDWRKLFLMSPFMRLFCCWFSFFLARGCFCSCGREGCAMSYLIWGCFFIHLMIFFQWFDEIQSRFFPPLFFFVWDFLCLVSLRRGRFFFLLICKKKVFVEWIFHIL